MFSAMPFDEYTCVTTAQLRYRTLPSSRKFPRAPFQPVSPKAATVLISLIIVLPSLEAHSNGIIQYVPLDDDYYACSDVCKQACPATHTCIYVPGSSWMLTCTYSERGISKLLIPWPQSAAQPILSQSGWLREVRESLAPAPDHGEPLSTSPSAPSLDHQVPLKGPNKS